MRDLRLPAAALTAALVLGACGRSPVQEAKADGAAPAGSVQALGEKGKKKPITEPEPNPVSACTAAYSGPTAAATTQNAVVDPTIRYGSLGTLILSFNTDEVVANAASIVTAKLGLKVGDGLGVLENLPMIAVTAPITQSLVTTLKSNLQPLGLLSIYQDKPLKYHLNTSVGYIKADAARAAFQTTGKGVGVAILDSGVDGTQGDFSNLKRNVKIAGPITGLAVGGYLYVDTPYGDTTSGHGTHVASTVGGQGTKSNGKYMGVAPGVNLVGVGAGDAISILYAVQGFDFIFKPEVMDTWNVRVIQNSWGSGGDFAPYNPVNIATKRAYDLGMIVNFSASNDGPAQDTMNQYGISPCVIAVAAGDKSGQLADFSSRGVPGHELKHPDITGPGVDIIAARALTGAVTPPYEGDLQYGAWYSMISGTSMATPHISGVVALMLEVDPNLNLDSALAALTSTAKPMYYDVNGTTKQREIWEVGAGYVDAYAAVQKVAATAGTRYTTVIEPLASWDGTVAPAITNPLGSAIVQAEHVYNLSVPTGASAVRIKTDWGNPAYDLDLYVYSPSGALVASSAEAASVSEAVAIPNPVAGTYKVQLKGYLNGPATYKGTSEIDKVTVLQ